MISWISLNMTPGVGPRAATKLLERFGSADAVFHARRTELESLRLTPETIDSALLTFLVTASGASALGIGAPFWGLMAGLLLHGARRLLPKT